MNVLKMSLIFSIIFGLVGFYLGDVAEAEKKDLPEVILQLQLRNSEGQLVSYIEGTQMRLINPFLFNVYFVSFPVHFLLSTR